MPRMPRARRRARIGALAALVLGLAAAAPTPAAAIAVTAGFDVSYPLCGLPLPAGAPFAIVGVNGGLANTANPCLATELAWAAATPGLTSPAQPPASLYLNTADPGPRVADWPTPAGGSAGGSTPYGACDGTWSTACAYLYGAQRAAVSYQSVASANAGVSPAFAPWWLDVETVSSWARPSDLAAWAAVNVASIQGFVAGLRLSGAGAPVGFYSTAAQWGAITGLDAAGTPSRLPASAPDWVAGTGTLSDAQAHCQDSFTGGPVRLAQYAAGGLDADYACAPAAAAGLRFASHTLKAGVLRVGGVVNPAYGGRVTLDLTATNRGLAFHLHRTVAVVGGRWQAALRLPRGAPLRGGLVVARSSARDGLLAGVARLRARLSP
jgi:hypothetical protein